MYYCFFVFNGLTYKTKAKEISVFQHGFWVTSLLEYTNGSDCAYWIPPSKIEYIEKV